MAEFYVATPDVEALRQELASAILAKISLNLTIVSSEGRREIAFHPTALDNGGDNIVFFGEAGEDQDGHIKAPALIEGEGEGEALIFQIDQIPSTDE